jgi:hypothetical protein
MPFTEKPHRHKILHNGYCLSFSNSARSLPLDPAIIPPHNNNNTPALSTPATKTGRKKNPKQNKTSQLIDRFAAQKKTQACKQHPASNIKEKTSKPTAKTRRKNEFVVVEEEKPLRLP